MFIIMIIKVILFIIMIIKIMIILMILLLIINIIMILLVIILIIIITLGRCFMLKVMCSNGVVALIELSAACLVACSCHHWLA